MAFAIIALRWKGLFWRKNGEITDDDKLWSQSAILSLVGLTAYVNNEWGVRNGLPDLFGGSTHYHHDEGVEYWDDVPFTVDPELNREDPSCDCKVLAAWLIAQCRMAGIRSATPYIKWDRRRRPDGRVTWMYHVLVFIDAEDLLALAKSGILPFQNTPTGPTLYKRKNNPGWLIDPSRVLGMNWENFYARSNRLPRTPEFAAWFEQTFKRPLQGVFVLDESNADPAKRVGILSSQPFLRAPALPPGTTQEETVEDAAGSEALMPDASGFDFSFLDPTNKKGMTRGLLQTLVPGGGLITALADKAAPAIHDATKSMLAPHPHPAAPGAPDDGVDDDDASAGAAIGDQRAWWSFIPFSQAKAVVQQAITLAPPEAKTRPGFQEALRDVAAAKFVRAYGKLTIAAPDSLVAAYGALGQDQSAVESAAYAAQAAWQQSASAGAIGDEMDPDSNPALQQKIGLATLEQLIDRIRVKPIVDAEGTEIGMRACLPVVFPIGEKPAGYEVCKSFLFSEAQRAVDELVKQGAIPAGAKASIEDAKDCGSKVIAKFFATWLNKVKDAGVVTNVAPEAAAAGFSALFLVADPELIADAITVVRQARAGDQGAIDKVKKLATAAQEGNTKALHAVQVIKAVDQAPPEPEPVTETEGETLGFWDRFS